MNTYHRLGSAQETWTRYDVKEEKITLTKVPHCSSCTAWKAQMSFKKWTWRRFQQTHLNPHVYLLQRFGWLARQPTSRLTNTTTSLILQPFPLQMSLTDWCSRGKSSYKYSRWSSRWESGCQVFFLTQCCWESWDHVIVMRFTKSSRSTMSHILWQKWPLSLLGKLICILFYCKTQLDWVHKCHKLDILQVVQKKNQTLKCVHKMSLPFTGSVLNKSYLTRLFPVLSYSLWSVFSVWRGKNVVCVRRRSGGSEKTPNWSYGWVERRSAWCNVTVIWPKGVSPQLFFFQAPDDKLTTDNRDYVG